MRSSSDFRPAAAINTEMWGFKRLLIHLTKIRENISPINDPNHDIEIAFNTVIDCIQDRILSLTLELARTPSADLYDLKVKVETLGEWCDTETDTKSVLAAAVVRDFALLKIGQPTLDRHRETEPCHPGEHG